MLLNNKTLEGIIEGRISVVFRVWKRPTVKAGGTLKTRAGVIGIDSVERIERSEVTADDIAAAGLSGFEELCEIDRDGDFYRIRVRYAGEDPRVAMRSNTDPQEIASVCERLRRMGDWTFGYLRAIAENPNTHAQILADSFGLEKLKFKARVRQLKALGLTESLRPGYRLSPRGEEVLRRMESG